MKTKNGSRINQNGMIPTNFRYRTSMMDHFFHIYFIYSTSNHPEKIHPNNKPIQTVTLVFFVGETLFLSSALLFGDFNTRFVFFKPLAKCCAASDPCQKDGRFHRQRLFKFICNSLTMISSTKAVNRFNS